MITDVLENTKAKYVEKLEEAKAKREIEINAKCDELRSILLAEPNAEIESLEKVIADLDALIQKEKAEQTATETVVEEQTPETVVEEVVEQPVEEVVEEPIEETVEEVAEPIQEEQPKVEVKEIEVEKSSLIQKISVLNKAEAKAKAEAENQAEAIAEEPTNETLSQKIVKISKPQGRIGMAGIFSPKRR